MSSVPQYWPAGTTFAAEDIVFYASSGERSLDEALEDADVLVSGPHSGSAIPEELVEFLAPEFTHRLQCLPGVMGLAIQALMHDRDRRAAVLPDEERGRA